MHFAGVYSILRATLKVFLEPLLRPRVGRERHLYAIAKLVARISTTPYEDDDYLLAPRARRGALKYLSTFLVHLEGINWKDSRTPHSLAPAARTFLHFLSRDLN